MAQQGTLPGMDTLGTGLLALHSHRAERLLDVVVEWVRQHPLAPLEEEVFIVQSNAVAEWLRMALADALGVCAATRVELPGRFFWRISRRVLGPRAVPAESPLDKLPLAWRLMQALPPLLAPSDGILQAATWVPLQAFLAPDPAQRLWPLCQRLADLYDQYQVYRPDWLDRWAQGLADVTDGAGRPQPLAVDQRWQARLWQVLHDGLTPEQRQTTRPALMRRVQDQLAHGMPVQPLPRRVVAFGMSHLPPGMLALLGAVSRHSQVLLAVPNPCQYHWADVIDGRELLCSAHRRQPLKGGVDRAALPLHQLHAHAHPLLAAWGRQSRDFVRLLDDLDDAAQHGGISRAQPGWPRLDLFVDDTDPEDTHPRSLLRQLQTRIRDLVPVAELPEQTGHGWTPGDHSVVFHIAHSPVRELEVLHDQLLAMLGGAGGGDLTPKDVVVMVPDIAPLAPAIRAVFGQYPKGDARHIPFDIADLGAEALSPLVDAWRWLWRLPTERAGLSEWLSLLEVPAIQARFGLDPDDLPRLATWLQGAGLRWGLHGAHRQQLGLPDLGDSHTARFALRRLLWGYALGDVPDEAVGGNESAPGRPKPTSAPLGGAATAGSVGGEVPFPDAVGLDAALVGVLAHLVDALDDWWALASQPAHPAEWVQRGHHLLQAVFQAGWRGDPDGDGAPATRLSPADEAALAAIAQAAERWLDACDQAGFDQPVPLAVARSAWDHALQAPESPARFHAGGVTFCTLLPMRAIPFRVVCLLGMNDGDYPRRAPRPDLDLIAQPGMARPGDRSRRDDDRQLMLEALMSARERLYISWCGRSVRDNTEQPPSVLVAQLRDHIAQGWGPPVLQALTTEHPLQPFSPRYLQGEPGLFTHAHEWRDAWFTTEFPNQEQESAAHQAVRPENHLNPSGESGSGQPPQPDWTLRDLADVLRHPVRVHFRRRLAIAFDHAAADTPDDEPFDLDGLERHALVRELLDPVAGAAEGAGCSDPATVAAQLQRRLDRAQRAGRLPLGAPGALWQARLLPELLRTWSAWHTAQQALPTPAERLALRWDGQGVEGQESTPGHLLLSDWLDGLHHPDPHSPAWATLVQHLPALAGAQTVCRLRDPSRVLPRPRADGKPSGKPQPHRLLNLWLRSLALSAMAPSSEHAHVVWVAADATLHARPMPALQAQSELSRLLVHAALALAQPLPLPPRTALALLRQTTDESSRRTPVDGGLPPGEGPARDGTPALPLSLLRQTYEGGPNQPGESEGDPYWLRLFPDLERLMADGRFQALAPPTWAPLLDWMAQHLTAWPHPEVAA